MHRRLYSSAVVSLCLLEGSGSDSESNPSIRCLALPRTSPTNSCAHFCAAAPHLLLSARILLVLLSSPQSMLVFVVDSSVPSAASSSCPPFHILIRSYGGLPCVWQILIRHPREGHASRSWFLRALFNSHSRGRSLACVCVRMTPMVGFLAATLSFSVAVRPECAGCRCLSQSLCDRMRADFLF